ncbi:MAG: LacI family DNA-binding transcriptional regulator [Longimonas sp.]|uniref:LacI family DNA-binding transcriptional regulator n=1 Tax=Longimonas sp. TaxID=2039626 RepID=UPI00335A018D
MTPSSESDKTTIYDVADAAGVAISTVSRVLNNSRDVSDATRERVLRAIEELQFRPNRTAKSLAQRATRTIAVAVPTFTTPFHNELLKGVRSRLDIGEVDLLLCDLAWSDPEATLRNFLARGAMDALLLTGLRYNPQVANELRALGAPVVMIGSKWEKMDSYYWEDEVGVELAVRHLIEQGHHKIGMITTPHDTHVRNARVRGYRDVLEEAGIAFDKSRVAWGETEKHDGFSEESGYEAMQKLLDTHPDLTAVFASSDVQAVGAWQAIRHAGLSVPENFALVGYDDIKISRFIGLSSVAQNMHDVGEKAAETLLRRLNREDFPTVNEQVQHELHIRKSSDHTISA